MKPTNKELIHYKNIFDTELHNILSYWSLHALEKNGKSFYGAVDINGNPVFDANKSCVLNSRILWTFSAAGKMNSDKGYSKYG